MSQASRSFDDLVIELDATQTSAGPEDNNAYGVMCRVQPNGDGYVLRISGDGYYSIKRRIGDDYQDLQDWVPSDTIRQGNATNHIGAVCDGPRLALFVNGQPVGQSSDSTFSGGDIAFIVTNYEGGTTEVHFDNLVVRSPAPMP